MSDPAASSSRSTTMDRWKPTPIEIYNPTLLRTDNYVTWRLEAQIHLDNADVWEVVSGVEIKPTNDIHDNWKRKNCLGRSLLLQLVSDVYKGTIYNNKSSADAWKILEDTLDRKPTMHRVNQILDMKKDESKSWNEHIAEFELRWAHVNLKVSTATDTSKPWIQGLKLAFSDLEFKAHLLLRTLPSTMDNIVGNLRTKDELSYSDVLAKILDLRPPDRLCPMSHQKSKKSVPIKSKSTPSSASSASSTIRPGIPPPKECSYCWKRHLPSKGHQDTNCLAAFLKELDGGEAAGSARISQEKGDIGRRLP